MSDPDKLFSACINYSKKNGFHRYACKMGLWFVEGRNQVRARGEALHYWAQYWMDGEYNHLINKLSQSAEEVKTHG